MPFDSWFCWVFLLGMPNFPFLWDGSAIVDTHSRYINIFLSSNRKIRSILILFPKLYLFQISYAFSFHRFYYFFLYFEFWTKMYERLVSWCVLIWPVRFQHRRFFLGHSKLVICVVRVIMYIFAWILGYISLNVVNWINLFVKCAIFLRCFLCLW